jgi:uroporphyrinogen decarboxylase
MDVATTPELAAEATLMPIDRFGVDGAVLFADIMLPLAGMGIPFEIKPNVGPVVADPIRTAAQVDRLRVVDPEEGTPYVLAALRLLKPELGERAALLGFAGAPFTLACYAVEGRSSREYPKTKALMYGAPDVWHALMEKLTGTTIAYLKGRSRPGPTPYSSLTHGSGCWAGHVRDPRPALYPPDLPRAEPARPNHPLQHGHNPVAGPDRSHRLPDGQR